MSERRKIEARSVRTGVVSVVLVTRDDTDAALDALERLSALEWSGELLEPIVVAPVDVSPALEAEVVKHHPKAKVVRVPGGVSVFTARNEGVEAATGEYVAFLDRDARAAPGWLRHAVDTLRQDANAAAIASKVLEEDGSIAFVDAEMTFAGEPTLPHAGKPDSGAFDRGRYVLFASEWAMVLETRAFRWVEGFDSNLSPGVEHADLGWRMWLAGFRIRYEPNSVVHRGPRLAVADVRRPALGGLGSLFKNLDDKNLPALLGPALLLADRQGTEQPRPSEVFFSRLPELSEARRRVQSLRQVADAEILPRFGDPMGSGTADERDVTLVHRSIDFDQTFSSRRRILIATPDVLQARMAGPAIRAFQMALALSREHDVQLVSTIRCDLTHPDIPIFHTSDAELRGVVDWADVVIMQGHLIEHHPWVRETNKVLVVDIYDPFHLEVLEQSRDLSPTQRRLTVRLAVETLNEQLTRGDFFLCASDKQRDFWLGQLAGIGRINPSTYDYHENLDSLIRVVPFGIDEQPPRATHPALRGVVPGIGLDDKIVLWGGGVYNWFDPITLVQAIDRLRRRVPNVRLYFMGMQHPNPLVPAMQMAARTKALAEDLDLVGRHVFFNEGWVEYDERQNYLLESDVGVSTHLDHVETAFSFRTRILDYLWASLPVVATAGDSLADVIDRQGLGITVPPNDVDALEAALYELLADDGRNAACRAAIAAVAPDHEWGRVLTPLLEFCRHPSRAADLVDPRQRAHLGDPIAQAMWGSRGWRHAARIAWGHIRRKEYDDLNRKLKFRLRTYLDPSSAGPGARQGP